MPIRVECAPAFDYARASHSTTFEADTTSTVSGQTKALFASEKLSLDLRYAVDSEPGVAAPEVQLQELDLRKQGHLGTSVAADFDLITGQSVTFILRVPPTAGSNSSLDPQISPVCGDAHGPQRLLTMCHNDRNYFITCRAKLTASGVGGLPSLSTMVGGAKTWSGLPSP